MSGKATLFRFKFLFSHLKFFLLIFIVFLFLGQSVDLSAQVIIKERVSIYPNSVPPITLYGGISDDPHNPVYLIYGGEVKVFLRHPGSQSALWYTTRLWEENLGLVASNKSQYDTVALGQFHQWEKFTFWITELNDPEIKYYPHRVLSDVFIYPNYWPGLTNSIWFFIPPIPDDSISNYPIRVWDIDVTRNDNYAAMPPPEILDYFGNPYIPSEEIIIPADGTVYMNVEDVNSNVQIDLYQDMPDNQLLLSDLGSHEGETINFGRKAAGDRLRFYIQSGHTVVNGMNLYPKTYHDEFFSNSDSSILFQDLWFEDWTDLFFDNLNCSVYLIPDHYADFPWSMQVQFSPAVLAPGDTANIILHRRNEDGSLETFPDDAFFDVQILDNSEYGTIYCPVWEDTSDFLISIPQVFQFIAKANIDTDSVVVRIAVNVSGVFAGVSVNDNPVIGIERFLPDSLVNAQKKSYRPGFLSLPKSQAGVEAPGNAPPTGPVIEDVIAEDLAFGIGEVLITEEKPLEIMLGETKYFQAKIDPSDTTRLIIEEVINPVLSGGIEDASIWSDSAITIESGNKSGVYWDRKYPKMINNGYAFTTGNKKLQMEDLSPGLIRIIGRYWQEDSSYVVKLSAEFKQKKAYKIIEVKKPSRLLSEGYSPSYSRSKDVFNNEYNVDSLCIKIGGKFGIPPHMIKGHMQTESATKNFTSDSGTTFTGFAPSYRYEPYTTQFDKDIQDLYKTNPFRVSDGAMGAPRALGVPTTTEHQHVRNRHYVEEPTTVWDFVEANSQLVNENNPRTYGERLTDGQMSFIYKKITDIYTPILNRFKIRLNTKLNPDSLSRAYEMARDSLVVFLREDWNVGISSNPRGLDSIWAQTRIAASYGLLQILYTTALDEGYPSTNNDRPENVNINSTGFIYMMNYQNTLFQKYNNFAIDKYDNWESGYEEALKVMYHKWNPGLTEKENGIKVPVYAKKVLNNSRHFLPRR
jgi:hypothetical protein